MTTPRCAGGCGNQIRPTAVLCPPCPALVHCADPFHHAAPTINIAAAYTLRHPAVNQ